ncbi:MAG TPA: hypothetical protein VNZ52_04195 [Candidatus Thermoplasmatota archaeon]|nr:hypothetical protein [Candidatus Thermoplasmatota archaeon]
MHRSAIFLFLAVSGLLAGCTVPGLTAGNLAGSDVPTLRSPEEMLLDPGDLKGKWTAHPPELHNGDWWRVRAESAFRTYFGEGDEDMPILEHEVIVFPTVEAAHESYLAGVPAFRALKEDGCRVTEENWGNGAIHARNGHYDKVAIRIGNTLHKLFFSEAPGMDMEAVAAAVIAKYATAPADGNGTPQPGSTLLQGPADALLLSAGDLPSTWKMGPVEQDAEEDGQMLPGLIDDARVEFLVEETDGEGAEAHTSTWPVAGQHTWLYRTAAAAHKAFLVQEEEIETASRHTRDEGKEQPWGDEGTLIARPSEDPSRTYTLYRKGNILSLLWTDYDAQAEAASLQEKAMAKHASA